MQDGVVPGDDPDSRIELLDASFDETLGTVTVVVAMTPSAESAAFSAEIAVVTSSRTSDALELNRRSRAPPRKLARKLGHRILKTRQPVQQQSSGGVDIRSDGRSFSTRQLGREMPPR